MTQLFRAARFQGFPELQAPRHGRRAPRHQRRRHGAWRGRWSAGPVLLPRRLEPGRGIGGPVGVPPKAPKQQDTYQIKKVYIYVYIYI